MAEIQKNRTLAQRLLDKCATWVNHSLVKFSKEKHEVLELGWNNLMHQHRLGTASDRLNGTWIKRTKNLRWMPE